MNQCKAFPKYKAVQPPRCGCTACWDKFFTLQIGRYNAARKAVDELGVDVIRKVQGDKYLKQLLRFKEQNGKR